MTDDSPTPEEIHDLVHSLENDDWEVYDYNVEYGSYEAHSVTIELNHSPGKDYDPEV